MAVAADGNVSHAAVRMSMSQPALSRMIAKIESAMDIELFERSSLGMRVTDAGSRLVDHAEHILLHIDHLEDEISLLKGELAGRVHIVVPDTMGHTILLPLIDRFADRHPGVELRVMDSPPNNIPLLLNAGDADVGIVSSAHRQPRSKPTMFGTENLHLVGPADSPLLESGLPIPLERLADLDLVLPAIQPGLRSRIDSSFAGIGCWPNVVLDIDSQDAIVALVAEGRAYSIMSYAGIRRHVARGVLAAAEITAPTIERSFSTALSDYRPATRLIQMVETELTALATELSPQLRWEPVS